MISDLDKIAVLIPFRYNKLILEKDESIKDLESCIDSINSSIIIAKSDEACNSLNIEIIIINDHSLCNFESVFSEKIKRNVRFINNELNQGQGYALNFALKTIDASCYTFTDSDCIVTENWIKKIVYYFNQNPQKTCIVGPNWIHIKPQNNWHKYITKNESRLMKFIFESYIDRNRTTCSRIDCRNLALRKSFVYQFPQREIFSTGVPGTSSHTSFIWRSVLNGSISQIGYSDNVIVNHKYIYSLKSHMLKYYQRGKYSNFRVLYKTDNESLAKTFFKRYLNRHFIKPLFKEKVSPFYLFIVHTSFWLGILFSSKQK